MLTGTAMTMQLAGGLPNDSNQVVSPDKGIELFPSD